MDGLVKHIDPATAHFKKRCVSVTPSPGNPARSTITFADGSTHEADLVIGADGVKSNVRNAVAGKRTEPYAAFSNTLAYRALVPFEEVKDAGLKTDLSKGMVCFIGKDKVRPTIPKHVDFPYKFAAHHCISNSGGTTRKWFQPRHILPPTRIVQINLVGFVTIGAVPQGESYPAGHTWVEQAPEEELVKHFEGWGHDAVTIINRVRKPSKWSIHVVYPAIESYVNGKVALIGDAVRYSFRLRG